jgi:hypothetical protein
MSEEMCEYHRTRLINGFCVQCELEAQEWGELNDSSSIGDGDLERVVSSLGSDESDLSPSAPMYDYEDDELSI